MVFLSRLLVSVLLVANSGALLPWYMPVKQFNATSERLEHKLRAGHDAISCAIAVRDAHHALRDSFLRSLRNQGKTGLTQQTRQQRDCESPRPADTQAVCQWKSHGSPRTKWRHRENLDGLPTAPPRGRRASIACGPPAQPPPRKPRPRRHSVGNVCDTLDPCAAHWLMSHMQDPPMACPGTQGLTLGLASLPGSPCGWPYPPAGNCARGDHASGHTGVSGPLSPDVQACTLPRSAGHGHSSTGMTSALYRGDKGKRLHQTQRTSSCCSRLMVYAAVETVRLHSLLAQAAFENVIVLTT